MCAYAFWAKLTELYLKKSGKDIKMSIAHIFMKQMQFEVFSWEIQASLVAAW